MIEVNDIVQIAKGKGEVGHADIGIVTTVFRDKWVIVRWPTPEGGSISQPIHSDKVEKVNG